MTPIAWQIPDWLYNETTIFLARLALAGALGGLIGAEREHHGRAAGFRTQILVCIGAALAMTVSLHFEHVFGSLPASGAVRVDPARVAYGVMTGIGFLGAGSILREGADIRGLTTAASLWCTAAIGLAAGFGMYIPAIAVTVATIGGLWALRGLDRRIPTIQELGLHAVFDLDDQDHLRQLTERLSDFKLRWKLDSIEKNIQAGHLVVKIEVELRRPHSPSTLVRDLGDLPALLRLRLDHLPVSAGDN
jgi:putative Mg2+ transporter-C (MgtC) family protein